MDFLSPQDPNEQPQQPNALDQFFANPKVQAGLLQGGLSLMQPMAWGDNVTSFLGRAIGSGAEAAQRQEAEDIKQQEASSKEDLRTAQAGAAEARSNTAAANSNTAAARLALISQAEEGKRERALNSLHVRAILGWQAANKAIEDRNFGKPSSKQEPKISWEDYVNDKGLSAILGGVPGTSSEVKRAPGWYPVSPGSRLAAAGKTEAYWDGTSWGDTR